MGRSVKQEFIADDRQRKQAFQKRKAGILKKASELTTLCGVDACAVMYSNNGSQLDVWPSSLEAHHLLQRFNDLPIVKQQANMMSHEKLLRQTILKLGNDLEKEMKKKRRVELEKLMMKSLDSGNCLCDVSNLEDVRDLDYVLDESVKVVNDRMEEIKHDGSGLGCGEDK